MAVYAESQRSYVAPSPTVLSFILRFSYGAERIKKARKENATLKRLCERKRAVFKKIHYEHHIVAIKGHLGVFLLGLACKTKCIVRSRRRRISMFGAFSYSAK